MSTSGAAQAVVMKPVERIRLGLLIAAAAIIAVVIAVAFQKKEKQIVVRDHGVRESPDNASVQLHEVSYSTTDSNNVTQWDLKAQSARYFKDENKVVLEVLSVNLYQEDDDVYRLKGRRGWFDTDTRDIVLQGGAEAFLPDGTVVKTDSVSYDHGRRVIETKDEILIRRKSFTMKGRGMVVDLNTEKMKILNNVRAQGSR